MAEEGLEAILRRHTNLARATRRGVQALNLTLFADEAHASPAVTAFRPPTRVDARNLIRVLRDDYDTIVAGGQGKLEGQLVRVGHLGLRDDPGHPRTSSAPSSSRCVTSTSRSSRAWRSPRRFARTRRARRSRRDRAHAPRARADTVGTRRSSAAHRKPPQPVVHVADPLAEDGLVLLRERCEVRVTTGLQRGRSRGTPRGRRRAHRPQRDQGDREDPRRGAASRRRRPCRRRRGQHRRSRGDRARRLRRERPARQHRVRGRAHDRARTAAAAARHRRGPQRPRRRVDALEVHRPRAARQDAGPRGHRPRRLGGRAPRGRLRDARRRARSRSRRRRARAPRERSWSSSTSCSAPRTSSRCTRRSPRRRATSSAPTRSRR